MREEYGKIMSDCRKFLPHGYVKELSRRLNISTTTVSKTLNGVSYNQEVFENILKDATEYKRTLKALKREFYSNDFA